MGSGPGSRNLGPPAALASDVTQPMGFGNLGQWLGQIQVKGHLRHPT